MKLHLSSVAAGVLGMLVGCGGASVSNPEPPVDNAITGGDSGAIDAPESLPDASPPTIGDSAPSIPETPTPGSGDHGAPSATYPAFPPDMPELASSGGSIFTSPTLITVTGDGDPSADRFEAFGDNLGASEYWAAVTKEYGVTGATSGLANHVRMPAGAFPATLEQGGSGAGTVEDWLVGNLTDLAKSKWPAPTDQAIYVVYLPAATSLQGGGKALCSAQGGVGGFHGSLKLGGKDISYAIINSCAFAPDSLVDTMTFAASHEIAEAATDPVPQQNPAFNGVDLLHWPWYSMMRLQVENGDLCEVAADSGLTLSSGALASFKVQRLWSNASAKAGHNPCVPTDPNAPYGSVAILGGATANLDLSQFTGQAGLTKVRGIKIPVNGTATVQVGYYSDAPTGAPITLKVCEGSLFASQTCALSTVSVAIDNPSGVNGEKANLTIKMLKAPTSRLGTVTLVIAARVGKGAARYVPLTVTTN
jgi:hypothetical protein